MANFAANLDHGALPAAIGELESSLKMERVKLGALGSLVFVGVSIGSIAASFIFNRLSYKYILVTSSLFNGAGLMLLTATTNFELMAVTRVICGFCQAFITIFCPLWVDTYSPDSKIKSYWLTLASLAAALGIVFGYLGTGALLNNDFSWQASFQMHAIINIVCALLLFFQPNRMINIDQVIDEKKHVVVTRLGRESIDEEDLQNLNQNEEDNDFRKLSICTQIKELFSVAPYVYSIIAMSALFFSATGMQYWMTNYLVIILKFSEGQAQMTFISICLTAPLLGAVVSTKISYAYGGHDSQDTLKAAIYCQFVGMVCALIIPFTDNAIVMLISLWIMLFTGGIHTPILLGTMLSSVKAEMRA